MTIYYLDVKARIPWNAKVMRLRPCYLNAKHKWLMIKWRIDVEKVDQKILKKKI